MRRVTIQHFPEPGPDLERVLEQVPDPAFRELSRALHAVAYRNEHDEAFCKRYDKREREKAEEKRASMLRAAEACLDGQWGDNHKQVAEDLLVDEYGKVREDDSSLRMFLSEAAKTERSPGFEGAPRRARGVKP